MRVDLEALDALSRRIIGGAMAVHRATGPGLLESVYVRCLVIELRALGMRVETDLRVPLTYRGVAVDSEFRLDLLVERTVIVEIKSIERLLPVHHAQVITYLKLMEMPRGLLLNFNVPLLVEGVRRVDHPTVYHTRRSSAGANEAKTVVSSGSPLADNCSLS